DDFVERCPGRVLPCRRSGGWPGNAAALKEAAARVSSDIFLRFEAGSVPGKGLVKQMVGAFFDPEVGAVVGRAVPLNVSSSRLTRLLELERSGVYQVGQQAQTNLRLAVPCASSVSGVRRGAP